MSIFQNREKRHTKVSWLRFTVAAAVLGAAVFAAYWMAGIVSPLAIGLLLAAALLVVFFLVYPRRPPSNLQETASPVLDSAAPDSSSGRFLAAPADGEVRLLTTIEDPVFSSEVLGKGCAIEPDRGEIVSPIDGIVEQIAETKHAIRLKGSDGLELLIHIGMDTVELRGSGFAPQVKAGEHVRKGQLLLKFDKASICAAGYPVTVPIIVTNTDHYTSIRLVASGHVTEGQDLLLIQ